MILTSQIANYPHLMSDKPLKEGGGEGCYYINACKLCPHSIPSSLEHHAFSLGRYIINNDSFISIAQTGMHMSAITKNLLY